jgi:hypothetical protein
MTLKEGKLTTRSFEQKKIKKVVGVSRSHANFLQFLFPIPPPYARNREMA